MNVNEYGITFTMGVSYNLANFTALSLTFTKPNRSVLTVTDPAVSIANANITTSAGTFLPNTYVLYTFAEGDVNLAGPWSVRLTYTANGIQLISDIGKFTVNP
jgi:hypothetical protein